MLKKRKDLVDYTRLAKLTPTEVLAQLGSSLNGLTKQQVAVAREQYGTNSLELKKKPSLGMQILKAYITPFTLVLILLGVISFITDYWLATPSDRDLSGVIIITVMVLVSGTMSLLQSIRSDQAAQKLKELIKVTASVKRAKEELKEIEVAQVVCGDIVKLAAGDMIPADMRLLQTKDLFIAQAALTGESYPLEKTTLDTQAKNVSPVQRDNLVFMGSNVVSGSALGVVIAVGTNTLFGQSAKELTKKPAPTNFDNGLKQVSYLLLRFMAIMAPLVVIINGLTKGDWWQALIFGLSIAVGLTPEMLPLIVTTNLVKGATQLAKKGTVVKNLGSIQNFGAMDVLCTDKTGTLTQDKIILEYHLNCDGKNDQRVLRHGYLNSYYQTGLKNLLDVAIIDAAKEQLDVSKLEFTKIDELPFDFKRRKMSVVVSNQDGKIQMITKGAIEEMLDSCAFVEVGNEIKPLTQAQKRDVLQRVEQLNQAGMRVIGVAHKTYAQAKEFSIADESDLILIGYLAFLDPPKETTKPALDALQKNGVAVKILTGDNALVAQAVCKQVGLTPGQIMTGQDIDELSDQQLKEKLATSNVFAKLDPKQKVRLVNCLKQTGNTVGFLGDGINDAPALRAADVGISVDTAVDIAKEAADIILLDKDLMILERAILAGRAVFGNIMKYIKTTISSNFGNMLSILCASIFLPFLPMLPLQILMLNLVYDVSCLAVPWDKMDAEYLQSPKNWQTKNLSKFMLWFGPTSSVFDLTTFAALYFVICPIAVGGSFTTLTPGQKVIFIALFHAGWFVESLWTQTFVLHALRTPKLPFIQSNAALAMTVLTGLGVLIGSYLPFSQLGKNIGLHALPLMFWGLLFLTVLAYLALVTVIKNRYLRCYQELI